MVKVRIHELAKELDVSSKDLITALAEEFGIEAKNHMSVIDEEDAELIKELYSDSSKKPANTGDEDIVEHYEEIENINAEKGFKKKKNPKRVKGDECKEEEVEKRVFEGGVIEINETIAVKEFAELLNKPTNEVIREIIFAGVMAGMNQEIDFVTAEKVANKLDVEVILREEEVSKVEEDTEAEEVDDNIEKRSPIVTVMGHVDHGKTSLLDVIKKTRITDTEAGGITQHIGAYMVDINGEKVTFLDTPGHEAFTSMRARGAQITDIVILVVAADDGIMPQTKEAISHCKAAGVPIIVAINKIDKVGANVDKVKQELTEYNLIAEDWGGDTICVPVSAHTEENIETLLEMVVLTAEMLELKANPARNAKGTVVEGRLDKGRGPVATLLVQNGTLHIGDAIIVGTTYGRIRAMFDDKGKNIKTAGPSVPVEVLGLSDVPQSGDRFVMVKDEKTARNRAESRKEKSRQDNFQRSHKVSLEDLYSQIKEGKVKELSIIVKTDVQGSAEALTQSLEKQSTDAVKVRIIHSAVGAITETDVTLAAASNAIVIGFNVRPDINAAAIAEKEGVDLKCYRIIYDAIEDVRTAMLGLLEPEYKEVVQGRTEIRQIYKISNVGTIAGCYVLDGKITRHSKVRLLRNGIVIVESTLASLKRFKDDAKEVATGYECGLNIERFNDIREGDIVESYIIEEIKPKNL
ncbi:MAG: translation initiation factor IF-2 [Clostridium sp.]